MSENAGCLLMVVGMMTCSAVESWEKVNMEKIHAQERADALKLGTEVKP